MHDEESRLDALRRAAYSRHSTPEQLAELREAEAREAEARAADGVAAAGRGASTTATPAQTPPSDAAAPSTVPVAAERAPASHRRWRIIAAAALLAVVIAAIGFSIGRVARPPDIRVTSTGVPGADSQRGTATLSLLESAQAPGDIPPFSLGYDIISSTVHRLIAHETPAVVVYGAISHEGLICLVAIDADQHSAQSCVTQHTFVTEGIRLRVTTGDTVTDDAGFAQRAFYQYYWSSDGAIAASTNQYLYPESPHR